MVTVPRKEATPRPPLALVDVRGGEVTLVSAAQIPFHLFGSMTPNETTLATLDYGDFHMTTMPTSRMQRAPRLRLGCDPGVTGAGSLIRGVRPLEHSTVKSLSQRNGTMKTTVVVLTTLLGAAIGVHAQSLLANGSFEALGPGNRTAFWIA